MLTAARAVLQRLNLGLTIYAACKKEKRRNAVNRVVKLNFMKNDS